MRYKFTLIMEEYKSRTASLISVTFWWVHPAVNLKHSVLSLSGKAEVALKGRNYQVQITWIFLLACGRMIPFSPFSLQCDSLSPSPTQGDEIEVSPR